MASFWALSCHPPYAAWFPRNGGRAMLEMFPVLRFLGDAGAAVKGEEPRKVRAEVAGSKSLGSDAGALLLS